MPGSPPTVLKKRHSLVGKNAVVMLIRKVKHEQKPHQLARVKINKQTEEMELGDICDNIKMLTGEDAEELLSMASVDHNAENTKLLLHWVVICANEHGQPEGQDLESSDVSCFTFVIMT